MSDKFKWIKIADNLHEIPFGTNDLAEIRAEEKTLCVARFKGELFAIPPKCPHASGSFVNGFIDAMGNVVCPLHRYKFCLKNGRNVSGEGYYLKHWPVEVRADGVFVGLEAPKFLGLF